MIGTAVVQIALTELGGKAVRCTPLKSKHYLLCIAIGAASLVIGYLGKLLPESLFDKIKHFKEEPINIEDIDKTISSRLRRKSSSRYGLKATQAGKF